MQPYAAPYQGKIKIVSTAQMGSLDGYLNLCEVVCCVLLVPRTIEVAETGVAAELHSLLFDIGQALGHRLRESVVRTVMQEAERFRYLRCFVETQDLLLASAKLNTAVGYESREISTFFGKRPLFHSFFRPYYLFSLIFA